MGCSQAVRHQTLTLVCVGPNPATPANKRGVRISERLFCWSEVAGEEQTALRQAGLLRQNLHIPDKRSFSTSVEASVTNPAKGETLKGDAFSFFMRKKRKRPPSNFPSKEKKAFQRKRKKFVRTKFLCFHRFARTHCHSYLPPPCTFWRGKKDAESPLSTRRRT